MPTGLSPGYSPMSRNYHGNTHELNGPQGDESAAASILQSVKEQEAQFEQLTRELEAERQSVATQLQRCNIGSETASMSSISSTDESFHWRPPPKDTLEEESDAESKVSGSHLLDSCLRVLSEKGLMERPGDDPNDYLPPQNNTDIGRKEQNNNMNGSLDYYRGEPHSPNGSIPQYGEPQYGQHTVTTVTKTVTTRQFREEDSPQEGNYGYSSFRQFQQEAPPPGSPGGSYRDAPTPTRENGPPDGYPQYPRPDGPPSEASYSGRNDAYGSNRQINERKTYITYDERDRFSDRGPPSDSGRGGQYPPDERYGGMPPPQNDGPEYGDQFPPDRDPYGSYNQGPDGPYGPGPQYGSKQDNRAPNDSFQGRPPMDSSFQGQPPMDNSFQGRPPMDDSFQGRPPYDNFQGRPPQDGGYPGGPPFRDSPQQSPRFQPHLANENSSLRSRSPGTGSDRAYNPTYGSHGALPGYDGSYPNTPSKDDRPNYPGAHQRGVDESPYGTPRKPESPYGTRQQLESPYGTPRKEDDQRSYTGPQYGDTAPQYGDPERSYAGDPERASLHSSQRMGPPYNGPVPDDDRPSFHGSQNVGPYRGQQPDDSYRPEESYRVQQPEDDRPSFHGSQNPMRPMYDDDRPSYHGSQNLAPPYPEDDRPSYHGSQHLNETLPLGRDPPPFDGPDYGPQDNSQFPPTDPDQRWRDPTLPEVIEYLSDRNDNIKANAAAYLQHLCYKNQQVKKDTRELNGIPALVRLVNHEIPEVHRNACGALRNLSYGRDNEENKKAICNCEGIPALMRLLRKSPDPDVRELVTGIVWNLSSSNDLKRPIIDGGLQTLVDTVIIRHSGWNSSIDPLKPPMSRQINWPVEFRNASGVLRNISSDDVYARQKLRQCKDLVDALIYIVQVAITKNEIDNKPVENCVCVLRNLSYACQEVEDPDYLKRKGHPGKPPSGADKGKSKDKSKDKKKEKDSKKKDKKGDKNKPTQEPGMPPPGMPISSYYLLWQPGIVKVYLPLLTDCTNPETLEAAAGAIQNLSACDWKPSEEIRAEVRKEKGLPVIVDLLNLESDRVVCAAATALRNLALDIRNKELIGKYAMQHLVSKLPHENMKAHDYMVSDESICAIEATLYEVIKKNWEFAQSLLREGGVARLVYITHSPKGRYSPKVIKFAYHLLRTMWGFKDLHTEYYRNGFKDEDFGVKSSGSKKDKSTKSPPPSAINTLDRPRETLSGPTMAGVNENTLQVNRPPNNMPPGYMDDMSRTPTMNRYGSRDQMPRDDIPLQNMGSQHNIPDHYASIDHRARFPYDDRRPDDQYSDRGGPDPYHPDQDRFSDRGGPDSYNDRGGPDQYNDRGGPDPYNDRGGPDPYGPPSGAPDQYNDDPYRRGDHLDNRPFDQSSYHNESYRGDDGYPGGGEYPPPPGSERGYQGSQNPMYPPGQQPQPMSDNRGEPLYAKVNKPSKREQQLEGAPSGGGQGGADSWV